MRTVIAATAGLLCAAGASASDRPADEALISWANETSNCGVNGAAYEVFAVTAGETARGVYLRYRKGDGGASIYSGMSLVLLEDGRWMGVCRNAMRGASYRIFD